MRLMLGVVCAYGETFFYSKVERKFGPTVVSILLPFPTLLSGLQYTYILNRDSSLSHFCSSQLAWYKLLPASCLRLLQCTLFWYASSLPHPCYTLTALFSVFHFVPLLFSSFLLVRLRELVLGTVPVGSIFCSSWSSPRMALLCRHRCSNGIGCIHLFISQLLSSLYQTAV